MLSPREFRELVSGRRRGLGAALIRGMLRVVSVPYGWGVRFRNRRYDAGRADVHQVDVPVICVGNVTLGGTGKTPMIAHLARWCAERGVRVAIVSRGYKATEDGHNDEALELAQRLPDVPHVQNVDRVAGAKEAIEKHGAQLVLLDDGFQHRRLHRDLDLVMIDALEPTGFGYLFPRGTLREPLTGLARAKLLVLSRANLVDAKQRQQVRAELCPYAPDAAWVEIAQTPQRLVSASGATKKIDELAGTRVAAFCGIGNPTGFEQTLANLGCDLREFKAFDDHHHYTDNDQRELAAIANGAGAEALTCTHKDLVKINADAIGDVPLWALEIGVDVLSGDAALDAALGAVIKA